jgi:hypothetical protein
MDYLLDEWLAGHPVGGAVASGQPVGWSSVCGSSTYSLAYPRLGGGRDVSGKTIIRGFKVVIVQRAAVEFMRRRGIGSPRSWHFVGSVVHSKSCG